MVEAGRIGCEWAWPAALMLAEAARRWEWSARADPQGR